MISPTAFYVSTDGHDDWNGADRPLSGRAARVGLVSANHLSRLLKRHFGVGARMIRKQQSPGGIRPPVR